MAEETSNSVPPAPVNAGRVFTPEPGLVTIEQAAATLNTPDWAAAGLAVREGWALGKLVTLSEYKARLDAWLNGPLEVL